MKILKLILILATVCAQNWVLGQTIFETPIKVHILGNLLSQAYLIETESGLVVVDPGTCGNEKKIIEKMRELERDDLKLIFITHAHFDHYGCALQLKQQFDAPIAIHRADSAALADGKTPLPHVRGSGIWGKIFLPLGELIWPPDKIRADIYFEDGFRFDELIGLPAEAVHIPGHTPGLSALLLNHELLFVGDLIENKSSVKMQYKYADDWALIEESYQKVKQMHVKRIFPGHGKAFEPDDL